MALTFRSATREDIPGINEIVSIRYRHTKPTYSPDDLNPGPYRFILVLSDQKIVGYCTLKLSPRSKEAQIRDYFILEDYRTVDIAAFRLYQETKKFCQENGIQELTTDCFSKDSRPFMKFLGFEAVGLCKHRVKINPDQPFLG